LVFLRNSTRKIKVVYFERVFEGFERKGGVFLKKSCLGSSIRSLLKLPLGGGE